MKNINLKQPILNFKGEPLLDDKEKVFTVGQALSNILLDEKVGGKMKVFVLAQKCFTQESIDVDEADFSLIKNAVEKSETYPNILIPGQLLVMLENLSEKK